ncbi:FAD-dependent 2-octaprenylphenol hydroxylase [Thaumasiovibrio subtropicus]|uniref:FAD-dependent 2-octaprenylphenol hydroxylase n=1 Tax=Thaumasiovibrio subtropicus TaxID=1891207 RepID=UPI000B3613E8|nr:FAD-dependent 2-octaprenylphenol hydroxylase [Thaumasiovibrio subtropicus]
MIQQVDIVIVGGGMVGLALAASLKNSDLEIAIIEGKVPEASLAALPDVRVSALNRASQRFLDCIGAWQGICHRRAAAYQHMLVWDKDGFGKIDFSANQLGEPDLGHIVENRVIQLALWEQVEQQENVTLIAPARCQSMAMGSRESFITLEDGRQMTAKLVVGADGANSWVRQQQQIPLTSWDYGHHALVANIRTAEPHDATARQIFCPQGPLAFLPLDEPNLCSIVWSLPPNEAEALMAMDPTAFNQSLTVAFDNQLGLCELEGERFSVPLKMRYARDFVRGRCVLIGDAAHTIHPLAGQGVNLGLMDAAALAETLQAILADGGDIGDEKALRQFERWRKSDAAHMIAAMEGFKQLFAGSHPVKRFTRNLGIVAAATLPGVKSTLMKKALGRHALVPQMAQ